MFCRKCWRYPILGFFAPEPKAGCEGWQLFHSLDNPNEITIILEWDTKEHATKFIESEDLKKTMQEAGVTTKPEVYFFEKMEDFSV